MAKDPKKGLSFDYDEQGTKQVSEQIMNAYNSGVIDQADGQYDLLKDQSEEADEME
ncbi:hypothetical protein ABE096_19620 [Robertmurraya massiliosenegalensis]|uniref:hypothetical protein n=1 Tax=Robertmurraya TaxID=2837507 RepID=UPI0039A50B77